MCVCVELSNITVFLFGPSVPYVWFILRLKMMMGVVDVMISLCNKRKEGSCAKRMCHKLITHLFVYMEHWLLCCVFIPSFYSDFIRLCRVWHSVTLHWKKKLDEFIPTFGEVLTIHDKISCRSSKSKSKCKRRALVNSKAHLGNFTRMQCLFGVMQIIFVSVSSR